MVVVRKGCGVGVEWGCGVIREVGVEGEWLWGCFLFILQVSEIV